MVSVATTATEGERFSLPPACDGRRVPALDVPVWEDADRSVGVADTSRKLDARDRLFDFCALGTSALDALPWAAFLFLLSGFSGSGHSTSRDRSIRSAGIHSR